MPGYAYPVEASSSEGGTIKSISYKVTNLTTPTTTFYTATAKTKVLSVLATNSRGSILPVKLHVFRDIDDSVSLVSENRVLKQRYLVQELISGDYRSDHLQDPAPKRHKPIAEFVLNQGDGLRATCPIADVVTLTVTLKEGIN
jgi:hypothetical protein